MFYSMPPIHPFITASMHLIKISSYSYNYMHTHSYEVYLLYHLNIECSNFRIQHSQTISTNVNALDICISNCNYGDNGKMLLFL